MRRFVSILLLVTACALVQPPAALAAIGDKNAIPVGLDVAVMRPVGMFATVGGMVVMVPVGLFTLMTRPMEIGKPFDAIVGGPARFTWKRPIGESWGDRVHKGR